jgi:hypothetical protein
MKKSFSKIRHIQESNQRLEKRLLGEQSDDFQDDKLQQIIDMDEELDNDPTYKEYEKIYSVNKIKKMVSDQMGIDISDMSDEESESLIDMFTSLMDVSKEGRNKMTRETLLDRKDSVINLVIEIMEIAIENDDFEMARKLKNYIKLLENYS